MRRATSSPCRSAPARDHRRGLGRKSAARYPARQPAQRRRGKARLAAASSPSCAASSTGWRTTRSARAAWCCACACAWASISAPARERVGVRLAGAAAAAHDRGAAPRARAPRRRLLRAKSEAAREAGVSPGVDRRPDRRRRAGDAWCCRRSRWRKARSGFRPQPEFSAAQRAGAAALQATVAQGGYSVTLLDGVTGSGKTEVYFEAVADTIRRRRQVADPDAGNRAHGALPRPLRRALRRPAGGMAFGIVAAQTRAHLARGRRRRGVGRGRRALGAVSALRRSRPDRRR